VNFGDFFWLLIWSFVFVFYLMILFQILGDLFRDRDLSGWWKAVPQRTDLPDRPRQGHGRASGG
jgi:hypothetical protein